MKAVVGPLLELQFFELNVFGQLGQRLILEIFRQEV